MRLGFGVRHRRGGSGSGRFRTGAGGSHRAGLLLLGPGERFVLLAGSEQLLQVACPYPAEIEKHRFVETSWEMEGMSDEELRKFYEALKRQPDARADGGNR